MNPQIFAWPCWYLFLALIWSAYQGVRGAVEQDWMNDCRGEAPLKIDSGITRWIVLYVHAFAFRFICAMAGFASLYACYAIATSNLDWKNLSTGTAAILAASFIVGVIGVGGQLHYVILLGKVKAE
jgi:hypothetical protein